MVEKIEKVRFADAGSILEGLLERFPAPKYRIEGPYYERTPEEKVVKNFQVEIEEVEEYGTTYYSLVANGQNLLAFGDSEFPFRSSLADAMAEAKALHGDRLDLQKQTVALERITGVEEIDGTGVILVTMDGCDDPKNPEELSFLMQEAKFDRRLRDCRAGIWQ